MKSLKTFLILALVATVTLVNFIAAVHGYRESMREAERLLDEQLSMQAHILGAVDARSGVVDTDTRPSRLLFQVWDVQGRMLARSRNAPASPLPEQPAGFQDINYGGYRWRSLAHFFPERGLWVLVAERADIRYRLAEEVVIESVLPTVLGLPLICLLVLIIVNAGLRPLTQLARKLRGKQPHDLSPITLEPAPRELTVLVDSANELLRRLESGFERERRFTADAAHELRTPIAALKVHLQNLIDEPGGADTGTLEKLKQAADRMGRLVEQILTLNRTVPEHYVARFACIDLFAVTRHVMESGLIAEATEKSQQLEFEGVPCEIYGDLFAIETLVLNLLGNAVKYTPAGGRIVVGTSVADGVVSLRVRDSGPGIPAAMRERVFERFYRLGGDRHESGTVGCGLGLSIVRQIAELHGAAVELSDSGMGSGLCVTVRFPRERQCANGEVVASEPGKPAR